MNNAGMDEKRFLELARRAARAGRSGYSHFIDPALTGAARRCAAEEGAQVEFYGGYEGAERVVAAFLPKDAAPEFPITCLELSWNTKFASAGHRDLLGAVMGLSIERSATGDIVMAGEGRAYLFAERDMAGYIMANLESAGRATLKIAEYDGEVEPPEPEGVRQRITLASARLDAFVSSGYKLSRSEAQKLIQSGLVKKDHAPEMHTDARVDEGSLISVRGYGRMKVEQLLGETKKGRLAAQVFRYGGK
jgi:RNA-binding protein YlmH